MKMRKVFAELIIAGLERKAGSSEALKKTINNIQSVLKTLNDAEQEPPALGDSRQ